MLDRQTKMFIGVIALVASTFLMVNHLVAQDPIENWWLAGLLFVLAAVMFTLLWLEGQEDQASTALTITDEEVIPKAQEWIISKDVVASPESKPSPELEQEVSEPEVTTTQPEAEIVETEPATTETEQEVSEPEVTTTQPEAEAVETEPTPTETESEVSEPDDLTKIEGVGPKYRDALVAAGITTFAALAAASLEDIQAAAAAAGMRNAASMETWAEQAAYAAKGDWDGLAELQEKLQGGRRT
ncbi:MAG: hypothetical protein CUN56_01035 [Phototrophicales bacterium]|nr:MAG: hypothetical protein CUN56_01035 [Phototrophicales bacterium]RMG76739.1 MAG: hypothetical protein D6711_03205 [Chloroflexota bacterium]